MNSDHKISVVIPVYNGEKYLTKCLDSILLQTYKNLEIILVNDGSVDSTGAICDEYASKDHRIIVIHKENGGVSSARNIALKILSGDYVTFVDSDDTLEPETYEKAMKSIRENDADACFFGWKRIREYDGQIEHTFKGRNGIGTSADAVKQILIFNGYAGHIWNKIFSTEHWTKDEAIVIPEMNTEYAVGEDCEWLMRMIVPYQKIVFLADELYNYLVRIDSAINIQKLTPARLTEIAAREKISEEVSLNWKEYEGVARAKAYLRLIQNAKLALKLHDKNAAAKIKPYLRKNRRFYFKSSETDFLKKSKALITEALINLV